GGVAAAQGRKSTRERPDIDARAAHYHCGLPHASWRHAVPQPERTHRTDRPGLDAEKGPAVSPAAVATGSGVVSKLEWWEGVQRGSLRRRCVSARPASRASPGVRGALESHDRPLAYTFPGTKHCRLDKP